MAKVSVDKIKKFSLDWNTAVCIVMSALIITWTANFQEFLTPIQKIKLSPGSIIFQNSCPRSYSNLQNL